MPAASLVLPASPQAPRARHRSRLCAALLLFVAVSPIVLHAQFQDPTPDELKMTADPKAPGASAVYLYHEETADDGNHTSTFYDRIKVLTEKGKELATVRVPYDPKIDKVAAIEGRTIHADGTIIPLTAKPDDLIDVKVKYFQLNSVSFNLPSVETGSILEYRVKFLRADSSRFSPSWMIQKPYFVHKAHFSFHPYTYGYEGLMFASRIPPGAQVILDKKTRSDTLDMTDIPPQPDDDWMPPLNTVRWRVEFYYTMVNTDKEFWDGAEKSWANWVREFTNPTGLLKKAAGELVSPGDTEAQKAGKIYTAVMKLENTDFTREKSEAERKKDKLKDINKAEDVWKQQSGSGADMALLYVALARAAGLNAVPMKIVNRDRALFDRSYLSTYQLDDYIAVVQLAGKDVFLDPGEKMCPFGLLQWKHSLASGFRLTEKSADIATTPPAIYKSSTIQRTGDLTIDASGGVKGTVRFTMTGQSPLYWRQLSLRNDELEVKKQFNESMRDYIPEGVQADFDHFLGLDESEAKLMGIIQVSGNLGAATGKRFFLPGLFFQSRAKHPFVAQDKRTNSVDVQYPRLEQDEVEYDLPAGFTVESAPQDTDTTWPNHAQIKIQSTKAENSVTVKRILAYNFTLLAPEDYPNLHDFYQKVATADQQQLVLTRAPVVKGN
jgi:hypothetical protein